VDTKTSTDLVALPTGATGAVENFKVSILEDVLGNLQAVLRMSPIDGATYESTRPDRSL
jgi:hypothetical protein